MPGSTWTDKENEILKAEAAKGTSDREIGKMLGRSKDSVFKHRRLLTVEKTSAEPIVIERPDVTNEEIIKLRRQNDYLNKLLGEERTALRYERRENSIAESLADIIREELKTPLPPLRWQPKEVNRSSAIECDAVFVLSDQHSDEVVTREQTFGLEDYDFDIFCCRLQRWAELGVGYSTRWLPAYNFTHGWVFDLGDGVQGDIHGHGPNNYFGNTIKAAIALGHAKAQALQMLLPCYPDGIDYVAVSGNHPRKNVNIKKDYAHGPHDNFDYLSSVIMQRLLRNEENLRVHLPDSWTAFAEVRGRTWALNHGDDVQSTWGIPWYGYERKTHRIQCQVRQFKDQRIDYFAFGHFHTPMVVSDNGVTRFHNGAFPYTDAFSVNAVSKGNEPLQWMLANDDRFGVINQVPLFLRDKDKETEFRNGNWKPVIGVDSELDSLFNPQTTSFPLIQAPAA